MQRYFVTDKIPKQLPVEVLFVEYTWTDKGWGWLAILNLEDDSKNEEELEELLRLKGFKGTINWLNEEENE